MTSTASARIPGWLVDAVLLLAVALASLALSGLIVVSGKQPLEATALAVIGGAILRSNGWVPKGYRKTIRLGDALLSLGIVCLGASLDFSLFLTNGMRIVLIILCTMIAGFAMTYALGRLFRLSNVLCVLLSVGTTICGGTAVAVIAPLIDAPEEETSYAIGTITLCGITAMLLYPFVARMLGIGDLTFGLFAGVAIHSTPQVVGAGFLFSDLAGKTATAVKLVRNCCIAPLAAVFAITHNHTRAAASSGKKAFPWFLFGFFILAGFASAGLIPPAAVATCTSVARFLILLGMADVGLNTDLRALKRIGPAPLIVGALGAAAVAVPAACIIAATR